MTAPTAAPAQPRQLSAAQIAALVALIQAQASVRAQLTQAAVAAAVQAFTALTDWWDSAKVNRAIMSALRMVQPTQTQAARLTDAYLVRAVGVMTGRRGNPAGAVDITRLRRAIPEQVAAALLAGRLEPAYVLLGEHDPAQRRVNPASTLNDPAVLVVPDPVRRGGGQPTDPADPYGRVADGYRYDLAIRQKTQAAALEKALVRVAAVAHTDITLAVREQVRKTLGQVRGVTGYRRILRPELSETGPCGLCVVAADRIYHVQDLKPIHDRCCCEVLPVIGDLDPGLTLNRSDLDRIYAAAGGTGGEVIKGGRRHSAALKRIRVALAEHGELGPILVDADTRYRGPREVAATRVADPLERLKFQLKGWEESFARLIRRREAGEDVDRPLAWQEARIADLRREIAALV